MDNLTGYKTKPLIINVNEVANNNSDGNWSIATSLIHNNNRGSYVGLDIPSLIEGDTYKITYTISSYGSCDVKIYLGNSVGTTRAGNGQFTDILQFTGSNKSLRFWSNGNASISYFKIEHLVKTVVDEEVDGLVNNSWTLSYNPILKQWISFHSYIPNNYISHPNKLLLKRNDTDIMISNSAEFGKYFDSSIKPFIIETIFNEGPTETKVFDSVHAHVETKLGEVSTNKFFDKTILYNEYQCSGEITLNLNNLTKKERTWSINKFSDMTNNLSQSIFVKDWNSIKQQYPIDKVVNVNKIDNNKDWFKRGRLRDKYLAVRFIENNLDNNKINCTFVISFFRASQR